MPSNHLILCRPLLLLPSVLPSIRIFCNASVLHIRLSKYWSFSFSISPSNEYSGLLSFRIESLQSKRLSSVFSNTTVQKHQFFDAQPTLWFNSHIHTWLLEKPYLWVHRHLSAKECLYFLVCFYIAHSFPSKEQAFSTFRVEVNICSDFEAQEQKVCHCLDCFPIYLPWSDGTRCRDFSFLNAEFEANFFTPLFQFH